MRRTAEQMFSSRRKSLSSVDAQLKRLVDAACPAGAQEAIAGGCDRCPAAAAVRIQLPSGSLLMLCGHHARRHAPALMVQGAVVTGKLALVAATTQPVRTGAG